MQVVKVKGVTGQDPLGQVGRRLWPHRQVQGSGDALTVRAGEGRRKVVLVRRQREPRIGDAPVDIEQAHSS